MIGATFIYAFQGVVAKVVERNVPSMEVVFVRSTLSGIVTLSTILRVTRSDAEVGTPLLERFLGDRSLWRLCILRGIFGAIAFSLAYTAYPYLNIGDAQAIFFTNPIWTALLAGPVLGESVSAYEVGGIAMGALGTLLIVHPPMLFGSGTGAGPISSTGVGVMLAAALFCSCAMISIRVVGKRVSALVLAAWFHGCSALMGAVAMCTFQPPVIPSQMDAFWLLVISVTSFFGQVMLNTGYQSLPALRAGALYYLMVAWSAVLGVVMLHETLDIISCSGSLFIFVGGIMPSIRKALKDQSQRESSTAS